MEQWMMWLSAIFSTKVLAQIVCFLGGILVMKSLSAVRNENDRRSSRARATAFDTVIIVVLQLSAGAAQLRDIGSFEQPAC
jgi:hypothetical protein